jgi:hypothetical protein
LRRAFGSWLIEGSGSSMTASTVIASEWLDERGGDEDVVDQFFAALVDA